MREGGREGRDLCRWRLFLPCLCSFLTYSLTSTLDYAHTKRQSKMASALALETFKKNAMFDHPTNHSPITHSSLRPSLPFLHTHRAKWPAPWPSRHLRKTPSFTTPQITHPISSPSLPPSPLPSFHRAKWPAPWLSRPSRKTPCSITPSAAKWLQLTSASASTPTAAWKRD